MSENIFLQTALARSYTKQQIELIAGWVGEDNKRFSELVSYFLHGQPGTDKLAAGVLSQVSIHYPNLVRPHLEVLISNLKQPVSTAIKRNTLRLLQHLEIPEKLQGRAADICFIYIQNAQETIAVRAFAITVLANICLTQPELKREFKLVLEEQLPFASAGFRVRARMAMETLNSGKAQLAFE